MKPSLFRLGLPQAWPAYLTLLVVYLVWGTTYGAIHIAVQTIEPAILGCLRFTLAGGLLMAWCMLRGESWPTGSALRRELLIGALLFFGGNSLSFWAVQHLPTGLAGTLVATNPFWMILLAALIPPRETVPKKAIIGLLIGFIGLLLLFLPKMANLGKTDLAFWLSIGGILVMVFFWALGSIMVRKLPGQASMLMGLGIQNAFAGLLLAPVALWTSHPLRFEPSVESLIALAYLVFFGSILATACYYIVLARLSVAVAGTFAYITPVITIAFGWLFLGETLSPWVLAGTAVILSGVGLVQTCRATEAKTCEKTPELPVLPMNQRVEEVSHGAHLTSHSSRR